MAIIQYKILHRTLKRAAQERIYLRRVREWLEIPGNEYCRVYRSLPASQCHHVRGRNNTLLLDERFWLPVSDLGHRWIHEHAGKAIESDLLAGPGDWNRPECDWNCMCIKCWNQGMDQDTCGKCGAKMFTVD